MVWYLLIVPKDKKALEAIKNTLSVADAAYVRLDKDGKIDKEFLNSNKSESGNYKDLQTLVADTKVYDVSVSSTYDYKDDKGAINSYDMGEVYKGDPVTGSLGPTTGKEGSLGKTQVPGKLVNVHNSPDDHVKVTVNSGLSDLGQAQLVSHELFGHGLLYSKGEAHKHSPVPAEGGGFKEGNRALAKQIVKSIAETTKNYEERNKKPD